MVRQSRLLEASIEKKLGATWFVLYFVKYLDSGGGKHLNEKFFLGIVFFFDFSRAAW